MKELIKKLRDKTELREVYWYQKSLADGYECFLLDTDDYEISIVDERNYCIKCCNEFDSPNEEECTDGNEHVFGGVNLGVYDEQGIVIDILDSFKYPELLELMDYVLSYHIDKKKSIIRKKLKTIEDILKDVLGE